MQGMIIAGQGATLIFPTSLRLLRPAHAGGRRRRTRRCASRTAAGMWTAGQAPDRTPAASSATSTRRSTSTAWSPAT
ncbi:MAG: hypothetical protein MZW92_60305 [Comamonadaceae bacterium]|nr:hypothetical protein [Comamonadaceae bacterium]